MPTTWEVMDEVAQSAQLTSEFQKNKRTLVSEVRRKLSNRSTQMSNSEHVRLLPQTNHLPMGKLKAQWLALQTSQYRNLNQTL